MRINPINYILNPLSKELTTKEKIVCTISSIGLGIITFGCSYLYTYLKQNKDSALKEKSFKVYKQESTEKTQEYNPLSIETSQLNLTKKEKKLIENKCMENYERSLKAFEISVGEAALEYISSHDDCIDIVDLLCKRHGDILEAYAKIQPHGSKIDPLHKLLRELFEDHEEDPGNIGSNPLAILNLIRGKKDSSMDVNTRIRTKMYVMYKMNHLMNSILSNPSLEKEINEWLAKENKGFQLDVALSNEIQKNALIFLKNRPLFSYGKEAKKNITGLRMPISEKEREELIRKDINPTYAEAIRGKNTADSPRYHTKLSEQEIFHGTGELENSEDRYIRNISARKPTEPIADTGYYETVRDYKMRTTQLPWIPGKFYYSVNNRIPCSYNDMVNNLRLPQKAGISGSLDQNFTMSGIVGINDYDRLVKLRLINLAWMLGNEDHSYHEIMQSSKSFNLPYTAGQTSYQDILPNDQQFLGLLKKHQLEQGYQLPDYYLSAVHVKKVAEDLAFDDHSKAAEIEKLMNNHELLMKTINMGKPKLDKNDLFLNKKWNGLFAQLSFHPILRKLKYYGADIKNAPSFNKETFVYNPESKSFEKKKVKKESYYKGTFKGSVSLVPKHGKVIPFLYQKQPNVNLKHKEESYDCLGLLINKNKTQYKDHYVFKANAQTNDQWWKTQMPKHFINSEKKQAFLGKEALKVEENPNAKLRVKEKELVESMNPFEESGEFIEFNEILSSINGESIEGIFYAVKTLSNPVENAGYEDYVMLLSIAKRQLVQKRLKKSLPIFALNPSKNQGLKHFSVLDQKNSIQNILNNEERLNSLAKTLIIRQGNSKNIDKEIDRIKPALITTLNKLEKNLRGAE